MSRHSLSCWMVSLLAVATSSAVSAHDGLVNSAELAHAGLHRMWTGQAELNTGRDHLSFVTLHINNSRAVAYFEIYVGENRVQSIATLDLDAFGNVLGFERAEERANLLSEKYEREIAATLLPKDTARADFDLIVYGHSEEAFQKRRELLAGANQSVSVKKYVEPRMTLYTLNSSNVLQAFDAETGLVRWTRAIGDRSAPGVGIAANDAMIAVVVGTQVYCVESEQGRVLWQQSCRSVPSAGPSMSQKHIFVPLANGMLETYSIAHSGVGSETYVSFGQINASPLVTGRTVSWPTEQGYYNIALFDRIGKIRTRIKTNGPISAAPAKQSRVLFIPSMDGYVYAVDELLGAIYWEFSSGTSISQQPVAYNEALYFVTDADDLFKLDARTGQIADGWPKFLSRIDRIIGVSEDYLYAINSNGSLVGLRHDTGAEAFSLDIGAGIHLLNSQTDRIFLVARDGTIQCLRQINQIHPRFNIPVSESVLGAGPKAKRSQRPIDELAQPESDDSNPFATEEELNADPFQVAEPVYDNPFVTSSEGDVNPFEVEFATEPPAGEEQPATDEPQEDESKPENPFGDG